jgi:hypothetical protein
MECALRHGEGGVGMFDSATARAGLTGKDVHLLRAALLDGPSVAADFAAWRDGLDIADIDYGWRDCCRWFSAT